MSLSKEQSGRADRIAAVLNSREGGALRFGDEELGDYLALLCLEIVRNDPAAELPPLCRAAVVQLGRKLELDASLSLEQVRERLDRYRAEHPPSPDLHRALSSFVREELASGARSVDGSRAAAFLGMKRNLPSPSPRPSGTLKPVFLNATILGRIAIEG